jgi:hypothetical protein
MHTRTLHISFLALLFFMGALPILLTAQTVTVVGAGTTEVNGTYSVSKILNGKPHYVKSIYQLYWDGTQWRLTDGKTIFYTNQEDTYQIQEQGWQAISGVSPMPSFTGDVITLNVKILDFKLKQMASGISLEWQISQFPGLEGFEIHQSEDGYLWEKLDFVSAESDSLEYSFLDRSPANSDQQSLHYRIKYIMSDGEFGYSRSLEILLEEWPTHLHVFPSRLSLNDSQVLGLDISPVFKSLTIRDMSGNLIDTFELEEERKYITLPSLSPGIYLLESIQDEERVTRRIVIY